MACNLSQIHFEGQLVSEPEISRTKKNKMFGRLLVEVKFIHQHQPADFQTETTFIPIVCLSREATTAQNLHRGDTVYCGAHIYGTAFDLPDGSVKRGLQLIADCLVIPERFQRSEKPSPILPAHS